MSRYLRASLVKALINHFGDDDRRIDHALRVTSWAEKILANEGGDLDVVLAVGMLHDVGIKEAEEKHGIATGKLQELYGPALAKEILESIGFPEDKSTEVCEIIGKHHTPEGVLGPNFPILCDADMLVNLRDDLGDVDREKMASIIEKSFKTKTGKELAKKEFLR